MDPLIYDVCPMHKSPKFLLQNYELGKIFSRRCDYIKVYRRTGKIFCMINSILNHVRIQHHMVLISDNSNFSALCFFTQHRFLHKFKALNRMFILTTQQAKSILIMNV